MWANPVDWSIAARNPIGEAIGDVGEKIGGAIASRRSRQLAEVATRAQLEHEGVVENTPANDFANLSRNIGQIRVSGGLPNPEDYLPGGTPHPVAPIRTYVPPRDSFGLRPLGKTGYAVDPTLTPEARAETIRQQHIQDLQGVLEQTPDQTARDYSGVLARAPAAIPQALFAPDRETPAQRAARERANQLATFAIQTALQRMRDAAAMGRTQATQAGETRRAAITHGDSQLGVTQKIIDDFQQERNAATADLNKLKSERYYQVYSATPSDSLASASASDPSLADFATRFQAAQQRVSDVGDSVQTYMAKRNAMAAVAPGSAARQPAAAASAAAPARAPGPARGAAKTPQQWTSDVWGDAVWRKAHPRATAEQVAAEAKRRAGM